MEGRVSEMASRATRLRCAGIVRGGVNAMLYSSQAMVDLLRSTLEQLEIETQDLDPNDPALLQFKASILRSIAELELKEPQAA